jgi:murein DD-endopeptidase MepM/ murein hydrolase activator NlpD
VSGDSWSKIASKNGVKLTELYAANKATASTPLHPGNIVCLPTTAATTATTTTIAATPVSIQLAAFPAQGPCWFTDTWQAPRGVGRVHEGVDIMAKAGQYVYAVANGTLSKQTLDRPGSLSGNAWWLSAADGTYYFYAHMSAFAPDLRVGSSVVAGQIIGFVGRTGNATGAHLHFEVHPKGGLAINPTPIVKAVDGCKVTEPLPQPSGTLPPTPSTLAPAGAGTTTVPSTTSPPVATAPVNTGPTVTSPQQQGPGTLWQFISPKTAFDSGSGVVGANVRQTVKVSGLIGVPAGTTGVLLRLTATGAATTGHIVTHPCDTTAPVASTLSLRPGATSVTSTAVRVVNGTICVTASTNVKVKVEVLAAQSATGVGVIPVTAMRVLDTRATARLTPGSTITLTPAALGVVNGTQALSMAVTFVNPAAAGTFSIGFCGQGPWNTPINADPVSSFAMTMRVNTSGWCLSSSVATDVIVDIVGVWAGASKLATVDPFRAYDSRGLGGLTSSPITVPIAGVGIVAAGSTSALLSFTVVAGSNATSVFAWPCGEGPSSGSIIAVSANRVTTAVVPVRLGGGAVCVSAVHPADVIIDVIAAG